MAATDIRGSLNNFIDSYLIFVADSISLISALGDMVKQNDVSDNVKGLLETSINKIMLLGKQVNNLYPLQSSDPDYNYTNINNILFAIVNDIQNAQGTLASNVELCKPKIRTGSIANKYAFGPLNDALIEESNNVNLDLLFQVKDTIENSQPSDYSLALIGSSGVTLINDILSNTENLDNIIESKLLLTNTQDDSISTLETLIEGLN